MPRFGWPLRLASGIGLLLGISQMSAAGCGKASASCDSFCSNVADKCASQDADLALDKCLEQCAAALKTVPDDCSSEMDGVLLCFAGADSLDCENLDRSAGCVDEVKALDQCTSTSSCADDDVACSADEDCCSGTCGTDGTCGASTCTQDGDSCFDDTECCNGACAGDGYCGSGGEACNDLLFDDPASASWTTTAADTDFSSQAAFAAYDALNTCACVDTLADGGCADVCTMDLNGTTTPNFCDSGATPNQSSSGCYGCLMTNCATQLSDCAAN